MKPQLILRLISLVFLAFGLYLFIRPESLSSVGVMLPGPAGRIEIRAIYGGLEIGFGVFLLISSRTPSLLGPGLLAAALTLGGAATARGIAFFIDGVFPAPLIATWAAEALGAFLAYAAYYKTGRS